MSIHFIGFIANVLSVIVWLPQAKVVVLNRHKRDELIGISLSTLSLALMNAIAWILYSLQLGVNGIWAMIPSLINMPILILSIVLLIRSRQEKE